MARLRNELLPRRRQLRGLSPRRRIPPAAARETPRTARAPGHVGAVRRARPGAQTWPRARRRAGGRGAAAAQGGQRIARAGTGEPCRRLPWLALPAMLLAPVPAVA